MDLSLHMQNWHSFSLYLNIRLLMSGGSHTRTNCAENIVSTAGVDKGCPPTPPKVSSLCPSPRDSPLPGQVSAFLFLKGSLTWNPLHLSIITAIHRGRFVVWGSAQDYQVTNVCG